jgi:FixJ family two-component response regulator
MPEMGGKDAYQHLKKINPDVKVVFTSGYGPQDRPDLLGSPGMIFLQKPFHTELLYQAIQTALNNGSGSSLHTLE